MKSHLFALVGFSTFSSLAGAGVVHVDVSSNGDVTLDINTEQQSVADPPKLLGTARPVYHLGKEPQVHDDDYIVDIWPGKHRGFLVGEVYCHLYALPNWILTMQNLQ